MQTFRDAKLSGEEQRKALARLAYLAFLERRIPGREGKAAQVADVAEGFHNLPLMLWRPKFRISCPRDFSVRYREKHSGREGFDYVAELDKIAQLKD
jgi:hypothetical protein